MAALTPDAVRSRPRDEAPNDRLGAWSVYFAVKLFLYFRGNIPLDLSLNLLFFAGLLVTSSPALPPLRKRMRNAAVWFAAAALLWHDSWLPSPLSALEFVKTGGLPSSAYMLTFLSQTLLSREILFAAIVAAAVAWSRRRIHLTWPLVAAFYLVGVHHSYHAPATGLDGRLEQFYKDQSRRHVAFAPAPKAPDIILIQVCSLAQDDIVAADLVDDPFWAHFDLLLTNYNTVTGYSGPAALRLLRANCGQTRHGALYDPAPGCSLFDALRAAGYRTYTALDHDGVYEGFGKTVQQEAKPDEALSSTGVPVRWISFDGTSIADDGAVLSRWWDRRQAVGGGPAALYANLLTMHTGSHRAGAADWWRIPTRDRYRQAFADMTHGIGELESRIAASGRPAVLVFVPEHGAALRGSSIQVQDLREMPLPYITTAPVGIKLIGFSGEARKQLLVSKPTSHLGLISVLADVRQATIHVTREALSAIVDRLPETPYVAENEGAVVIEADGKYYLKARQGAWMPLPPDTLAGRK